MPPPTLSFRWWNTVTPAELRSALDAGAACIRYDYVASLVFVTVRWQSKVHLVRHDWEAFVRAIPYTLFTLVFGWWGVPWGPIDSAKAIWSNFGGGRDATVEVEASLDQP